MKKEIRWTTENPTKPGFYWELCIKNGKKEIHVVKAVKSKGHIYFRNTAFIIGENYEHILFSVNPIPYPKTPSIEEIKNIVGSDKD